MEHEPITTDTAAEDWEIVELDDRQSPTAKEALIFIAGAVGQWIIS